MIPLVTTFFMLGRLNADRARQVSPDRVLFLPDGASFEAGDRTLTAVRPPIFDNPTTRGLFDTKTGVYWSADAFSASIVYYNAKIIIERVPAFIDWFEDVAFTGLMFVAGGAAPLPGAGSDAAAMTGRARPATTALIVRGERA